MVNKMKNWKPVEIDGNVFSSGFEGLIGIEECTDYDLGDLVETKNVKKKRKKDDTKQPNKANKKVKEIIVKSEPNLLSPSKSGDTSISEVTSLEDVEEFDTSAWLNFDLPESILKALAELKFKEPTQIQSLTLPSAILGRKNILGAAETGSGKTLAFGLPILTGILKIKEKDGDNIEENSDDSEEELEDLDENGHGCVNAYKIKEKHPQKPLYALILTPTRELAMQIKSHLTKVAKYTGINIAVVVGGMAAVKQERLLGKFPEIVVATPGRLWELIQQGNQHLSQVDKIRFLAIDETDRMLERGHFQELHSLIEKINVDEEILKKRQSFVFSATLTLIHDIPRHLINKQKIKGRRNLKDMTPEQKLLKIVNSLGIKDPKIVDITQGTGTSSTLTECRITCKITDKDFYVYYFLQKHPGRTLIFCNSIGCVKRLNTLLTLLDCHPLPLHASMQQRQRLKNLERFTEDELGILIATDVAARGLDIPSVEHVLHYQTPRTSESYVHRSGRTARASKEGITVLLIEPTELPNYLKLCRTLGKDEDLPIFPVQENYLNAVKQRVNLARELDKLQLQVKKATSETGWLEKAAEEMDIIVDDMAKRYDTKEAQKSKKLAEIKRKHLASMLSKPVFPKGFSGKYPLATGELVLPMEVTDQNEKAVDVMKAAVETYSKQKSRFVKLYKGNKKQLERKDGVIKLPKFKNEGKKGKKFKRK
ncbi:unnamed protein product [Brassicogethes aeneus]|uniref:ATP-dependent RNA helicase n=1 Tax=Brassicogethes aeneus TaxID=1431903 RepID=A0A9P0AZE1_BRAAE|nr:unnamed protein product [Brassicogethes aeneus]